MKFPFYPTAEYKGVAILRKDGDPHFFIAIRIGDAVVVSGADKETTVKETIDNAPGRNQMLSYQQCLELMTLPAEQTGSYVRDGQHRTRA